MWILKKIFTDQFFKISFVYCLFQFFNNMCLVLNGVDLSKKKHSFYYGVGKYGKYGKYGNYGSYGSYGKYGKYGTYGQYGSYGNYSNSHYGNANDNSIKK